MKESIKNIVLHLNEVRICIDLNKLSLINKACLIMDKEDLLKIVDDISILNKSYLLLDELCSNIGKLLR